MPWPFTFQHGFSKQKSHYMFQQPLHFANWLQSKICTELFLIPMHPSEKLPFVTENSFISCKEYFTYRLLPQRSVTSYLLPSPKYSKHLHIQEIPRPKSNLQFFLSFPQFKSLNLHLQTKSIPASKTLQGNWIP